MSYVGHKHATGRALYSLSDMPWHDICLKVTVKMSRSRNSEIKGDVEVFNHNNLMTSRKIHNSIHDAIHGIFYSLKQQFYTVLEHISIIYNVSFLSNTTKYESETYRGQHKIIIITIYHVYPTVYIWGVSLEVKLLRQ